MHLLGLSPTPITPALDESPTQKEQDKDSPGDRLLLLRQPERRRRRRRLGRRLSAEASGAKRKKEAGLGGNGGCDRGVDHKSFGEQ